MEFNMGLFILRWRTPGRSENPSVHIFSKETALLSLWQGITG